MHKRTDYVATGEWVNRLWGDPHELCELIERWLEDAESAANEIIDGKPGDVPSEFGRMTDLLVAICDSRTSIDGTPLDKLNRAIHSARHPGVWDFGDAPDGATVTSMLREAMRALERLAIVCRAEQTKTTSSEWSEPMDKADIARQIKRSLKQLGRWVTAGKIELRACGGKWRYRLPEK